MENESSDYFLIVGLGNPGRGYELTRHNLGFLAIEALAKKHGFVFKEDKRFNALFSKGKIGGANVMLLKPMTFMNLSGSSVQRALSFYKLGIERMNVVCDDVALDFSVLRIREKGSAGGHNGLKDIERALGTKEYTRL